MAAKARATTAKVARSDGTQKGNLTVVQEMPAEQAGVVTFWSLSGQTNYTALVEAATAAKLDEHTPLPTLPSPKAALGRAVSELKERRQLVRKLGEGWAFIAEREDTSDEKLRHRQVGSVKLDVVQRPVFSDDTPGEIREKVGSEFWKLTSELSHHDIGGWLTDTALRLGGVLLRDTGGIWFIPRTSAELWRTLAKVLRSASAHSVYEIPALQASETVDAVLEAVQREAEATLAEFNADIAELNDDGTPRYGAKALRGREEQTAKVESKLARYEELLGRGIDGLREKIESCRAALAVAALKREAELAAEDAIP